MADPHVVLRLDRDDYQHLQRAYARLHLTPSQIMRLAMDRFLAEPTYRTRHPFALPRPVVNDALEDAPSVGAADSPMKISVRVSRERQVALKKLLQPRRFGLGAFLRGALVEPGRVLGSAYLEDRMLDLCGERDSYVWPTPPMDLANLDIDQQLA